MYEFPGPCSLGRKNRGNTEGRPLQHVAQHPTERATLPSSRNLVSSEPARAY